MFKNHIKVAFRNLRKQKLYSFINILGLALGIACCIVIYLFVRHEYSYDRFHEKADRIYRVQDVRYESVEAAHAKLSFFDTRVPEGVDKYAVLPLPLGPTLKERYPEIRQIVRYDEGGAILRNEDKIFDEPVRYVEQTFFKVFSFDLLEGNPEKALSQKHNVVLTEEIAQKYFEDENPVGKAIQIKIRDEEMTFTVTGIAEPPPDYSSIKYGVLLPIQNKPFFDHHIDNWRSFNTALFLELESNTEPEQVETKLNEFYAERFRDAMAKARERNNMPEDVKVMEFTLTPITNIHLDASVEWSGNSNPLYSYILSGIAVLILFIACINYITLALARSSNRAREVGIRKTVGAHRRQVARQFFGETLLLTFLAFFAGIALAELILPVFNGIAGKELVINYIQDRSFLLIITALTILVGIIAGIYPALFLSRFNAAEVLKGQSIYQFRPKLTKGLMVIQYSLSVFLIVSSVIMYRQLDYVSQKELGYDEEQVIVVPTHTGWNEKGTILMQRYRDALTTVPEVASVSGMAPAFTTGSNVYGFSVNNKQRSSFIYYVDHQLVETLGMELIAGRDFSADRPADRKNSIVVNQALVESMGWDEPVGQLLPWKGQDDPSTVIGIVKDFHFLSLEAPIQPMLFHMDPEQGGINSIMIKIKAGQIAQALPAMESVWAEVASFTPFDYWFLDDAVTDQYTLYKQWMEIMAYSTAIAILIACLGLFGLAGITAVNRNKEIGIRKVLGASIRQIIIMLNKDVVKLIAISIIIAAPVSWYIMQQWLTDFAYHIEVGVGIFLISAVVALIIAILTVSYHSIKTAILNPVESLRSE